MRTRSIAIDVVRVVGVVGVVAGHLFTTAAGVSDPLRVALYSWHVPLFFFLTGYLWSYGRPVKREFVSRGRALLVPFIVWTLLLGVPLFALTTVRSGFPAEQIGLTIWGGGLVRGFFAPYWFLPLLFFVAVLLRMLEKFPRWVAYAAAGVGLVCSYLWGAELSRLPQDIFFTLPCMLFALLGQEFRRMQPRIPSPTLVGFITIAACGVLLGTGAARPLDMKLGDFGTPSVSVFVSSAICAGLLLIAQGLLKEREYRWGAFVTELATTSVVVLLVHTFILAGLSFLGVPALVIFVVTLLASWALALVVHRTPLSPWLAGVPRRAVTARRAAPAVRT